MCICDCLPYAICQQRPVWQICEIIEKSLVMNLFAILIDFSDVVPNCQNTDYTPLSIEFRNHADMSAYFFIFDLPFQLEVTLLALIDDFLQHGLVFHGGISSGK